MGNREKTFVPPLSENAMVDETGNEVDWDGPNDPSNPINWSTARKATTLTIVSAMGFTAYVQC
jgi:hypothetical protein